MATVAAALAASSSFFLLLLLLVGSSFVQLLLGEHVLLDLHVQAIRVYPVKEGLHYASKTKAMHQSSTVLVLAVQLQSHASLT
eukprot:894475-Amphidinium_carterae.5